MQRIAEQLRPLAFGLLIATGSCVGEGEGPVLGDAEGAASPDATMRPTVTDDTGRPFLRERPVDRLVSFIPSITETVAAVRPDALVGRTRYDRGPAFEHLPSLGGTLRPDLEMLARLRPDLVVMWSDVASQQIAERIEGLGVSVYRAEVESVADVLRHARRLGVLLDRRERADALVDSIDAGLRRVSEAVAGREPVDVYYSLWHDPPQTTGSGTFIDEIIRTAGGRNVFADAHGSWPRISMEELLRRDPDVLVIARRRALVDRMSDGDGSGDDVGSARPGETDTAVAWLDGPVWRKLSAVRDGRYLIVDDDLFNRPGPRVAEAAQRLASFLHGPDRARLGVASESRRRPW